jgi:hypothetical protein
MIRIIISLLFPFVLFSGQAGAVMLTLDPVDQEINTGDMATVNLNISGLGNFSSPSLGAFFTEITFNNSILSLDSVSYGSFLGDPNDPVETDILTTTGPGLVSLDEFSFLFDFELDALQPDSFTLASLSFSGIGLGTSTIDFGFIDLSDAVGFTINPSLAGANISVTSVPEPSSLLLFLIGIGFILLRTQRHTTPIAMRTYKVSRYVGSFANFRY